MGAGIAQPHGAPKHAGVITFTKGLTTAAAVKNTTVKVSGSLEGCARFPTLPGASGPVTSGLLTATIVVPPGSTCDAVTSGVVKGTVSVTWDEADPLHPGKLKKVGADKATVASFTQSATDPRVFTIVSNSFSKSKTPAFVSQRVTLTITVDEDATAIGQLCSTPKQGLVSLHYTGAHAASTLDMSPGTDSDWPSFHNGPDRAGFQPHESTIGVGNVGSLTQARTYPGGASAPVVVNGVLYEDSNQLRAYDATGNTGCSGSPTSCAPLWTAAAGAGGNDLTVANGVAYVNGNYGLYAFDAAGSKNCGGSPKVCSPLWQTATGPGSGPALVANGVVYVTGFGDGGALQNGGAYILAYDAAGKKNCGGSPVTCAPLWTTIGAPSGVRGSYGTVAASNGLVYVVVNGTLYAFDANGSKGCSGTPVVCQPLWSAAGVGLVYSTPSVGAGRVFVTSWNAKVYAFDAAGKSGCSGTPKKCNPLWTAQTTASIGGTAAIANGIVYVVNETGVLNTYDAAGTNGCTGSPKTCAPLFSHTPNGSGGGTASSPAVANGVVYSTAADGTVVAIDASGNTGCSGTPKTCSALFTVNNPYIAGDVAPAIVNSVLYFNVSGNGTIYAYTL
jgi:hypothetical protein